jgi:PAS domain S-box-containing protein
MTTETVGEGIMGTSDQTHRFWLAAIVESADDAIVSKDLDGIVTSWNRAAERLFGYGAEEMVGRPISILAAPGREEEMPLILERVRRGEMVDRYETQRRHKDGHVIDISLTVSPVRDGLGRIVGASKIARDIRERKRTESQLRLMANELDHRAKNVLAVAQAMLRLTKADDVQNYVATVQGRIAALARAHTQVAQNHWHGASLGDLVRSELEPFRSERAHLGIAGPETVLQPVAAQAIAIVLHELATNAAKHGALSAPGGAVDVSWSRDGADGDLSLLWTETGGPPVLAPSRRSFGSQVIERQVPEQLGGTARIDWDPAGLRCTFGIPRAHLSAPLVESPLQASRLAPPEAALPG